MNVDQIYFYLLKLNLNLRIGPNSNYKTLSLVTKINAFTLSKKFSFIFWKRHCLRVRYRTSRLRGYGSGTGPLDTDSRGPVPDTEPRL